MKKHRKKIVLLSFVLSSTCWLSFSQPSLSDYLSNDLELKRLSLELKKTILSSKSTKIDNGIDIQLSTGTATFTFSEDDSYVKFQPSAKLALPQASNLAFTTSTKITKSGQEEDQTQIDDTKFSLSADIISGSLLTRKINLKKAERQVLEARRKLQDYALTAENNYYKQLRSLFETSSSIISSQKTMYDDTIDFEEIKAKGYAESSTKYRQALIDVLSDKHDVETKVHKLERDCAIFASKCNIEFTEGSQPKDFLPTEIPLVEALDILSFDKEDHKKIESARWNQEIAILNRKADKNFSLSASAGYTIKNSDTKSSTDKEKEASDTVDAGLQATFSGLTVGAGASIPTNGESPVYTLSASLNPNSFRKLSIKKKQNQLNQEEEEIEILNALNSYEEDVISKERSLNDLLWTKETNSETYKMYIKLEEDQKRHLQNGIISESEYLTALANRELYRIKLLMNDIDLIIYNNETKLLFCRDGELQNEEN